MRLGFVLTVLTVVALILPSITMGADFDTNSQVALEAYAKRLIYSVDQDVELIIYIRNMGKKTQKVIEPAIDARSLQVEVICPDGSVDKKIAIYGLELKTLELLPGKRIKYKTGFSPEKLGKYEVKISYMGYNQVKLTAPPVYVYILRPSEPLSSVSKPALSVGEE